MGIEEKLKRPKVRIRKVEDYFFPAFLLTTLPKSFEKPSNYISGKNSKQHFVCPTHFIIVSSSSCLPLPGFVVAVAVVVGARSALLA